jgi:hypothetical protein
MVNREQYLKEMQACVENNYQEDAHIDADALLCRLLEELNYGDVVELWYKVGKWYS